MTDSVVDMTTGDSLQAFHPMGSLTADQRLTLSREVAIEYYIAGQPIIRAGESDGLHHYIYFGRVVRRDRDGETVIDDSDDIARWPLAEGQPRRADVIAAADTAILQVPADLLDRMLCWHQVAQHMLVMDSGDSGDVDLDWIATLLRSNLFYKVPPINVRDVLARFERRDVAVGEVIMHEGDAPDHCYYIIAGEAEVWQAPEPGGAQELVAVLGSGRWFGEDALVYDTVRNATICMRTEGALMRLNKQDFFDLLRGPFVETIGHRQACEVVDACWLDVRTEVEFERGHLPEALHVPLGTLGLHARRFDRERTYLIYCDTGRRSAAAAWLLAQQGFQARAVDPSSLTW